MFRVSVHTHTRKPWSLQIKNIAIFLVLIWCVQIQSSSKVFQAGSPGPPRGQRGLRLGSTNKSLQYRFTLITVLDHFPQSSNWESQLVRVGEDFGKGSTDHSQSRIASFLWFFLFLAASRHQNGIAIGRSDRCRTSVRRKSDIFICAAAGGVGRFSFGVSGRDALSLSLSLSLCVCVCLCVCVFCTWRVYRAKPDRWPPGRPS